MRKRPFASLVLGSAVFWTVSSLYAQSTPPAIVPPIPPAVDTGATVDADVMGFINLLNDPASKQEQRDLAARRLLSRAGEVSRNALRTALANIQQPGAQLATARALSECPQTDRTLINPLFALLDPNASRPLIDSASRALSAFKSDADVLTRLLKLAKEGSDERIRLAVIRTIGTFAEKRAAQGLIDLLDPTAQPPSINSGAADALTYMTGVTTLGVDADPWHKWWTGYADKSDDAFRTDILISRAIRFDQVRQSTSDVTNELTKVLRDQYNQTARDLQSEVLMKYLKSTSPTLRSTGAKVVADVALSDGVTPVVREQLRSLIADNSAEVRKQVAMALSVINDNDSLLPLLAQLAIEPETSVRSAIAAALKPINDVRAVPALLTLLDDPSLDTAIASAQALGEKGLGAKIIAADISMAKSAGEKLTDVLSKRTAAQVNIDLRNELIRAMVELRQRSFIPVLVRLVNSPAEAPKVRRSLIDAIGSMKDPQLAGTLIDLLNDNDPNIRSAAVRAIGDIADSFDYGEKIRALLDDSNQMVRDDAWNTLKKLISKAPTKQLSLFAERFRKDSARRVVILSELNDRAKSLSNEDESASWMQQMGEALMDDKRPEEAITNFRQALTIREKNNQISYIEPLCESLIESLLKARHYTEAIDFASQQIKKDPAFQGILGPHIKNESEFLVNTARDYDNALKLIDAALKMDPPLKEGFKFELERMLKIVNTRPNQQNNNPFPTLIQSARAS